MKIHHLDCGTMCPVAAARTIGGDRLICHVLLIETERDGLLLVDTAFSRRDCREPTRLPGIFRAIARPKLDESQTAAAQVLRLGFRIEDVRHVVITHLDLDHAGGLADFPAATVHLHADEHRAATAPDTLVDRFRYLRRQWAHGATWRPYRTDGEPWLGLPAARALDGVRDEIALIALPGHSRGHSGVAVKDGDRWLLHAGDAYFARAEITGGRVPLGLRAFATVDEVDRRARLASVAQLRTLARRPDVTVINSHDPTHLLS